MTITEPATMLTDYLMSAFCFYWGWTLLRRRRARGPRLWAVGFLSAALAALTGGTFHGFASHLDKPALDLLWNATVFSIGAAAGFMLSGLWHVTLGAGRIWFLRGAGVTLLGLLLLILKISPHPHFNQNDLYHIVQIFGLYGFYRGALHLRDSGNQRGRTTGSDHASTT